MTIDGITIVVAGTRPPVIPRAPPRHVTLLFAIFFALDVVHMGKTFSPTAPCFAIVGPA